MLAKVYSTVTPIYFGYQEIYTVYIVGRKEAIAGMIDKINLSSKVLEVMMINYRLKSAI